MKETCTLCNQALPKDTLGGRVNVLRVKMGLTMRKLAAHLRVSPSTISRVENDEDLSIETLKNLADFFQVSLDYLVYGRGPNDRS